MRSMWECPKLGDVRDWPMWWLSRVKGEEASMVAMTVWMCWNERNSSLHGGQARLPEEVLAAASSNLAQFVAATETREGSERGKQLRGGEQRVVNRREDAVWLPPRQGVIKVNVDGAVFKGVGIGLGVVIRDSVGDVLRSACQQAKQGWEVDVIEAKAIALGLRLASQCYEREVEVECDNLRVVSLINGAQREGSQLGIIVREIRHLASNFSSIKFNHEFREANMAAHTMARLSPLDFTTRVWVGGCPSILDDVIASDFCLINKDN